MQHLPSLIIPKQIKLLISVLSLKGILHRFFILNPVYMLFP